MGTECMAATGARPCRTWQLPPACCHLAPSVSLCCGLPGGQSLWRRCSWHDGCARISHLPSNGPQPTVCEHRLSRDGWGDFRPVFHSFSQSPQWDEAQLSTVEAGLSLHFDTWSPPCSFLIFPLFYWYSLCLPDKLRALESFLRVSLQAEFKLRHYYLTMIQCGLISTSASSGKPPLAAPTTGTDLCLQSHSACWPQPSYFSSSRPPYFILCFISCI